MCFDTLSKFTYLREDIWIRYKMKLLFVEGSPPALGSFFFLCTRVIRGTPNSWNLFQRFPVASHPQRSTPTRRLESSLYDIVSSDATLVNPHQRFHYDRIIPLVGCSIFLLLLLLFLPFCSERVARGLLSFPLIKAIMKTLPLATERTCPELVLGIGTPLLSRSRSAFFFFSLLFDKDSS